MDQTEDNCFSELLERAFAGAREVKLLRATNDMLMVRIREQDATIEVIMRSLHDIMLERNQLFAQLTPPAPVVEVSPVIAAIGRMRNRDDTRPNSSW